MELESLLYGAAAHQGARAGRSGRSSREGVCGLSAGCSTPRAEKKHRPCSPKPWGCQVHPTQGMRPPGSAGEGRASTNQSQPITALAELGSRACPSLCRPTGQGASTPRSASAASHPVGKGSGGHKPVCLIPHFSQCFKKHPWLTAEEGVRRPNASGPLSSLGQSIRERASADVRAQEPSLLARALLPRSNV